MGSTWPFSWEIQNIKLIFVQIVLANFNFYCFCGTGAVHAQPV